MTKMMQQSFQVLLLLLNQEEPVFHIQVTCDNLHHHAKCCHMTFMCNKIHNEISEDTKSFYVEEL